MGSIQQKSIKRQDLHFWLDPKEPLQCHQFSLGQVKHHWGLAAFDHSGYLKLNHDGEKSPNLTLVLLLKWMKTFFKTKLLFESFYIYRKFLSFALIFTVVTLFKKKEVENVYWHEPYSLCAFSSTRNVTLQALFEMFSFFLHTLEGYVEFPH